MNSSFVVEFYEKPTHPVPVGRVLVTEDADDAGRVAEVLRDFFDHLKKNRPQFHDAGLMCARFIYWQLARFEHAGDPPESRKLFLIRDSRSFDGVVAEVYANSYRPEVRFKRTEMTTALELLIAAEVLQQANI